MQLGSQYMTDRGKLLKNLDRIFNWPTYLLHAIVVPVCVTTMAGLNDYLLLPVHNRELSNIVANISNSVWICSRCKSSLKKHKLPSFTSVNNMHIPPVPLELSCLNSMEKRLRWRPSNFTKPYNYLVNIMT